MYGLEYAAAGRGEGDGKAEIRARAAQFAERVQRTKAAELEQFTQRQEALSRERRARMARIDQLLQESRALRALVDLKYEARLTTQGQILGAMRRGAL